MLLVVVVVVVVAVFVVVLALTDLITLRVNGAGSSHSEVEEYLGGNTGKYQKADADISLLEQFLHPSKYGLDYTSNMEKCVRMSRSFKTKHRRQLCDCCTLI